LSAADTADYAGENTMHPAAVEERFRVGTEKLRGWGTGLLVLAAILWGYAAWQLFTPYEVHWGKYGNVDCSVPAFTGQETLEDLYVDRDSDAQRCASARDWRRPVGALVLATPLTTAGGVLLAMGVVSDRLRRHEADLKRARG
jgi:hypothetical protein